MEIFFSSDWHLGHKNIIGYCNRPFADVREMDNAIIDRLNERVGERDLLYFLGDMAFVSSECTLFLYLKRIRCKNIAVILGNHDDKHMFRDSSFLWVRDLKKILVDVAGQSQGIVLCHYAMRVWNRSHSGAWHLYGHSHGTLPDDLFSRSMDVGVDTHNFYPYHLDEIAAVMAKKKFEPVDAHGAAR